MKIIQFEEETTAGKLLKKLAKYAEDEVGFNPTRQMVKAKSRLWDSINSNPILSTSLSDMTIHAITELAGTDRLLDWADKYPFFLAWLCDEKYEKHDMEALAEEAKRKIREIMNAPLELKLLTAKDQLNAANMILQLADKYPNKRREFVYIDKELAKMTEADVVRENAKLDRMLLSGESGLDDDGNKA